MDFGAYASFSGTKSEPDQRVFWPRDDSKSPDADDLVPFDDRRSIRRIVVEKPILDGFWEKRGTAGLL
jgi:hypothetical protein